MRKCTERALKGPGREEEWRADLCRNLGREVGAVCAAEEQKWKGGKAMRAASPMALDAGISPRRETAV